MTNPLRRYARYVAIGDSSTEGLEDFDANGSYRGWSRRLAQTLASTQGELLYANLGVRGWTTRQILQTQVPLALAMQPDLVTMFSGTNDVLRKDWDLQSVVQDMEQMQRSFLDIGATVLTFTLPDLTPNIPIARWIAPRIYEMNAALHAVSMRTGAILLDLASYPVATDARLWDEDRIHANAAGHERIANALVFALQLPGSDESWKAALAPQAHPTTLLRWKREALWMVRYFIPWLSRRMGLRRQQSPRQFPGSLEPVIPVPGVGD